jgi:hypothetical protein
VYNYYVAPHKFIVRGMFNPSTVGWLTAALHSSKSHAFLPLLYVALTTEDIHPSAAILFRYRSNGSRDSAVSIYLEVTSRSHFRVRLPFLAVTSPFHSHTPRIKTKPKTLSRQNLKTDRVSMLLKSRASPDMLPFSRCNKKRLAIRQMNRPLFPTTLSIPSYDIRK